MKKSMIKKYLNHEVIKVSMKEQKGVAELEEVIKKMFFHGKLEFNEEVYITNARHKAALLHASNSLNMVLESIVMDMPEDFYSIDLLSAYKALGRILGEEIDDDVVNEIFSKFCMGK